MPGTRINRKLVDTFVVTVAFVMCFVRPAHADVFEDAHKERVMIDAGKWR